MNFKIATRRSKLAQVQADMVGSMLKSKYNAEYEKILIETTGDKILDKPLEDIGGKGLFIKDIEISMMEGNGDLAVHSMKDVPYDLPEGFEIVAVPQREDARDVFVSLSGVDFNLLPKGAKVGTSSNRRTSQIKQLRPDIEIVPIRGNVQTRIEKIKRDNLDGMILAAAGLKRLDLESIIMNYFDPNDFVPAVGQGALGIEAKCDSPYMEYFKGLNHYESRICVEAERSFMRKLNGDCHTIVGAYATLEGSYMHIVGIFNVEGKLVKKDIEGKSENYMELGLKLAEKIMEV
ncbi:porphobilinogen deaminase [Oxobacter pfennigii]|uniref:Porphobilinogen deaminase n=1 Tax=Oxobacter pfennigii TaxID=36849 RepID=A0A0P8W6H6_9CLOT|nr:hydroxymethylbilane synthase [Oxobacter pfennigii]KPU43614.1 porphobilinogen deaminase [Oxobacter pfennigii]